MKIKELDFPFAPTYLPALVTTGKLVFIKNSYHIETLNSLQPLKCPPSPMTSIPLSSAPIFPIEGFSKHYGVLKTTFER